MIYEFSKRKYISAVILKWVIIRSFMLWLTK